MKKRLELKNKLEIIFVICTKKDINFKPQKNKTFQIYQNKIYLLHQKMEFIENI